MATQSHRHGEGHTETAMAHVRGADIDAKGDADATVSPCSISSGVTPTDIAMAPEEQISRKEQCCAHPSALCMHLVALRSLFS
jgi:hypothetical protein